MRKKLQKITMDKRRETIVQHLANSGGTVRTNDLLAMLPDITRPKLAADLNWLMEQGKVARVGHGTYVVSKPLHNSGRRLPLFTQSVYWERTGHQSLEKQAIARYIVKTFFGTDGTYGLDAGTTLTMVFQELVASRPPSAIKIITNNLHGVCLVPPASQIDLSLVGGKIAYEYVATCGPFDESELEQLDVAVVGFSRITKERGVWTFDKPQWKWKRGLCKAKHVVFAGTLDKIGTGFNGEAMHALDGIEYTVVADANAADFTARERDLVESERELFGHRLVLVNDEGNPVTKLMTD